MPGSKVGKGFYAMARMAPPEISGPTTKEDPCVMLMICVVLMVVEYV